MTVVHVDPIADPRWAALVASASPWTEDWRRPTSDTIFHSPAWLGAVVDTYGFDVRAAVDLAPPAESRLRRWSRRPPAEPTPLGGLAYAVLDDELGPRIAMPFTDVCGIEHVDWTGEGRSTKDFRPVMDGLLHAVTRHGLPCTVRSHGYVMFGSNWSETKRAAWHRLSLLHDPTDGSSWWERAAGPFRQGVRKAERSGLDVRPLNVEADGGVDSFARLHRGLRRSKYQMLSQPEAFFAAIRDRFVPDGGWHPLGAFDGDQLVAATVYLRWGDTLFYKFNASDPRALAARPNNLLVAAGAELARSLGCDAIDLGPSDEDQPGLIRFKSQTGAAMDQVRTWTWTPPGWEPDPSVARLKRTLGELTGLLVQPAVDDAVVHAAGDALYRWFA